MGQGGDYSLHCTGTTKRLEKPPLPEAFAPWCGQILVSHRGEVPCGAGFEEAESGDAGSQVPPNFNEEGLARGLPQNLNCELEVWVRPLRRVCVNMPLYF